MARHKILIGFRFLKAEIKIDTEFDILLGARQDIIKRNKERNYQIH